MRTHTSEAAAAAATNRHYSLPPEVFATFLGERLKYSCGIYRSRSASLDRAQEDKLRFIARCLGIRGGESVLDIGAGWGSLTLFLAEEFGCRVTAVTPSATQIGYIRARAEDKGLRALVTVDHRSVYDLDAADTGSFDAVALVGVMEHLPTHHRAVRIAARSLREFGRMYLSATCFRNTAVFEEYARRDGSRYVAEDTFGYGILRPFSQLVAAVEDAELSVVSIADLTAHYHRTIEDWLDGVRAHREIIDAVSPGLGDDLTRYLEIPQSGWGYTTKHYALAAVREPTTPTETS
ncbi:SAM-dependent methyltransferase [Nocardia sp. NPDC004068]|uniref:SAM-dependent methyltransferase n=1 Tax=Nocardia sp. NPDC004068 TaxID=3364303 RepID=UPI0036A43EDB